LKLNTVLMRSCNSAGLEGLVRTAAQFGCEIRFVELMPFGEGAALFAREFLPASEALAELKSRFPYRGIRGYSATAERHSFDVNGRSVTVGFIPSVTRPFCSRCDRLRLDSRGRLYGCLRARSGVDLCATQAGGLSLAASSIRAELNRVITRRDRFECDWPSHSMALLGG
jgi:cyclic pyranopterin phosphate synthase